MPGDLPLPACGERVGVRGTLHGFGLADSPPHPAVIFDAIPPLPASRARERAQTRRGVTRVLVLIVISTLNGVLFGMLLFLMASGLTVIFSMLGVLNFAHASFY